LKISKYELNKAENGLKNMNHKRILAPALTAILLTSVFFMYSGHAAQATALSLTPATISGSTLQIGGNFTIKVHVDGVSNLWGWTVSLSWNPQVLQLLGSPMEGPFLKVVAATTFIPAPANNALGTLPSVSCVLLTPVSASGNGDLANMTFKIINHGLSTINVTNCELDAPPDNNGNTPTIPVTATGATLSFQDPSDNSSPSPTPNSTSSHGPKAIFSPLDRDSFRLGDEITLDATSSTPGYDINNVSEICPITSFVWRVEFLNGTVFGTYTGKTASFIATSEGDFKITLIVSAVDPHPPSDPSFVATDSDTAVIHVGSTPGITDIDVFTDKGGEGPNVSCGAYSPQQLLQIYALVTYRTSPVSNQNVAFSIRSSNGSIIALRTTQTNATGIAHVEYRPPSLDAEALEGSFGTWSITASVNVTQATFNDAAIFTYGYLSSIQNVQLSAATIQKSQSLFIQFSISSIGDSTKWSELELTIFDQVQVPIGSFSMKNIHLTQNSSDVAATIPIPQWAFSGQATIYICLLREESGTTFVPLAPEVAVPFQIQ
jgi:hypothetical protein